MKKDKKSKGVAATGIIAALAASSCCIPPIIAAIAGVGGAAGSLSWMEPLRPYLIGLAVVAIGYAWYNHFKTKSTDDCGCEIEKQKWYQTKSFLIGMTLFAVVSITIPYYSHFFFSDNKKEVIVVDKSTIEKINLNIEGMTCVSCEQHIDHSVNELEGIININSSYELGNTEIEFDNTKTTIEEIKKAINKTGYSIINTK
jgi:copper chaperone CopZ